MCSLRDPEVPGQCEEALRYSARSRIPAETLARANAGSLVLARAHRPLKWEYARVEAARFSLQTLADSDAPRDPACQCQPRASGPKRADVTVRVKGS
jgi:hypothetical protein